MSAEEDPRQDVVLSHSREDMAPLEVDAADLTLPASGDEPSSPAPEREDEEEQEEEEERQAEESKEAEYESASSASEHEEEAEQEPEAGRLERDGQGRLRGGPVEKRTHGAVRRTWQRRWAALEGGRLFLYKPGQPRPRTSVLLSDASAAESGGAVVSFRFCGRSFELRAGSAAEASEWAEALRRHAGEADAQPGVPATDPRRPWRVTDSRQVPHVPPRTMAAADVAEQCRTGDLLLFRTRGVKGGVVRAATRGSYDHVGMFLRFRGGRMGVVETLANTGVQITNWLGFVREWHRQYSVLAVRRMHANVDEGMAQRISEFVRRVDGRKYRWTPSKQMQTVSTLDFGDEARTFFCSELVASALKHMGVLPARLSAARYTPRMFEERYGLPLAGGARLGHEIRVVFREEHGLDDN